MLDKKLFQGIVSKDKYQSGNPIANALINNFLKVILRFTKKAHPKKIHEVGCGEGQICGYLAKHGFEIRGCDIAEESLQVARSEAARFNLNIRFKHASIYELNPKSDAADLVLCCEVLEHLDYPEKALSVLAQLANPYLILSVPNEPLWRILNLARGKYIRFLGNTPGHIQHWNKKKFISMVNRYVEISEVKQTIPWIVLFCKARK